MTQRLFSGPRAQAATGFTAILISGLLLSTALGRAGNDRDRDGRGSDREERRQIEIGFAEAPVPLNLKHKDLDLVGLGSYNVNVKNDCNICHSAGTATEFTGNPYQFQAPSLTVDQIKKVNPATYLGGGRDFSTVAGSIIHIYSRNLTPDISGKPIGGHTLAEFIRIMRTGHDYDNIHPTCPASPTPAQAAICLPYPYDGSLLQTMPWPAYKDMTDHDLQAIYEYSSAVPCLPGLAVGGQQKNVCP